MFISKKLNIQQNSIMHQWNYHLNYVVLYNKVHNKIISLRVGKPMKLSPQKPFYQFSIHAQSFKHKRLPIKQRIQSEYLPRYWRKLKLDQKIVKPNEEDRLSKLTIKQIDRIIDMEKIKYVLNGNKNGNQHLYLDKYKTAENKHPNVYRANFLAKVNKIAIDRKIFTEQAEGFQSIYGQFNPQSIRRRQLQKQKQNVKYVKQYKARKKDLKSFSLQQMGNKNQFQIDQDKSISSIDYQRNMEEFEQNLDGLQNLKMNHKNKSFRDDKRLLCSRRWFDGMSTHFIEKKNFFKQNITEDRDKRLIDISSTLQKRSNQKRNRNSLMFDFQRVKTEFPMAFSQSIDNPYRNSLITSSIESY